MPRLIACFANSYLKYGVQAAIEHLPTVGIAHLEFPIRTAGQPTFFGDEPLLTDAATPQDVAAVRRRLEVAGLSVSTGNVTVGNLLDPQDVARARRKMDIAADLGAICVVGGAGAADSEEERPALLAHLGTLGDHAANRGLIYCCETHPGLCVNAAGMLDTMRRLDHPHIRLNFDTGNLGYYTAGADVLAALRQVRDYVRHVHLKDHNGRAGDWHFPALGAGGAVDFTAVRELLDEVGFDGPYSLEIEGIRDEPVSLELCHQRIADSLRHLRDCGYFS